MESQRYSSNNDFLKLYKRKAITRPRKNWMNHQTGGILLDLIFVLREWNCQQGWVQNFVTIIIMGNIQVVGSQSRRKPIFNQLNSSQFKASRSPRQFQEEQQTHRFTNNNRVYKARESDAEDTSRHRNGSYYRISEKKSEYQKPTIEIPQDNESWGEGNRIGNFNDFLIELKKQMTQNSNSYSEKSSQLEQTLRRGVEGQKLQKNDSNRELKINLRLENERFELDKYKKLVERELSKSHSIENISLENKHDNEKLLIIKYGEYINETKQTTYKQSTFKNASNLSFGTPLRKELPTQHTHTNQKIIEEKKQYFEVLKQAQLLMKQMEGRMEELGQFIDAHEKQYQTLEEIKSKEAQTNRISRISDLMSGISHLQVEQIDLENQIKAAIQIEDESDLSQTLTENQFAAREEKYKR